MPFEIPFDHPALPGHFPGHPLVPGVLLLARMQAAVRAHLPDQMAVGLRKVKFLRPLLPGQRCEVTVALPRDGRVRVECRHDGERIAEALFVLAAGRPA